MCGFRNVCVYVLVININIYIYMYVCMYVCKSVAQWLKRCPINRKVAGTIPGDVIGICH